MITPARTTSALTDALRAEHEHLRTRIEALGEAAQALARGEDPGDLHELVTWLARHLIPHARAEEAVLYPAVDAAAGSPSATATMRIDHEEIVDRLEELAHLLADEGADPVLGPRLAALGAVVLLHLRKEEAALLPLLDEHLDPEQAERLLATLQAAAHHDEEE